MDSLEKYGLDLHCTMILEEYRENLPVYEKLNSLVSEYLHKIISENGLYVTAIETRIKTEKSLAGKLEIKGGKYEDIFALTDIVGARVITFYSDEVDKIAALVDKLLDIDWKNSVDKRKMHDLDSFGYNSIHYICTIPKELYFDPAMPQLNNIRFEIQMRTALQHVWATMYHDTGYKSGVDIPINYLRNLNRIAGMLELADEQFSLIRTAINDYRRQVQGLVSTGKFEEVTLNLDTFRSYLAIRPFDELMKRIAAINQAEIHETSLIPYLKVLRILGFKTLGEVEDMRKRFSEDAYQFAAYQIASTDIDILSSTVALQDLLVVYILSNGGGERGLVNMFDTLGGKSEYNEVRAKRVFETARNLPFLNQ